MMTILIVLAVQCVIGVIIIFVLKNLLDKELMEAAIERLEGHKSSEDVKEVLVQSASELTSRWVDHLQVICKRKFIHAHLNIQQDKSLKGGVVIIVADERLDFSLANRLKHFWS